MSTSLERFLAYAVLDRKQRKPRKPARRRGLLALCLSYIQFPEHDEKYKHWIRSLPCCIPECNRGRIEAAHTGLDGGGKLKASDRSCVPLCREHHSLYHGLNGGKRAVEARFCIDFSAVVQRLNAEYERIG